MQGAILMLLRVLVLRAYMGASEVMIRSTKHDTHHVHVDVDSTGNAALESDPDEHTSEHNSDDDGDDKKDVLLDSATVDANAAARVQLAIETDFRQLSRDHFMVWSPNVSCLENAQNAFVHFVASVPGKQAKGEYTQEEFDSWKKNFIEDFRYRCKHRKQGSDNFQEEVSEALENEKPAVPKGLVESINNANVGYKVTQHSWMRNATVKDIRARLGLKLPANTASVDAAQLLEQGLTASNIDVPSDFDASAKWPQCSEMFNRAENQGTCGSCWVFAAIFAVESRLCIATNASFSGPYARLSRGFATSCARKDNGCDGGASPDVFQLLSNQGIPSGDKGCVEYFADGEGTEHFSTTREAPPCPSDCTRGGYARNLTDDKYSMGGFKKYYVYYPSNNLIHKKARENIYNFGPAPFGLYSGSSFMGYKSGIYKDNCGTVPNHEVVAIGFGPNWFLGMNSWGPDWGDKGKFKVDDCVVYDWTLPYEPIDVKKGLPQPLFLQPFAVNNGSCTVAPDYCVQSPNYPKPYGNNEACSITLSGEMKLQVSAFETEKDDDYIVVGGTKYSGTNSPSEVTVSGTMTWTSDGDVPSRGWKICQKPGAKKSESVKANPVILLVMCIAACVLSGQLF